MSETCFQPSLFPNILPESSTRKFQIKRFDDTQFNIVITATNDEDPETIALENLGYFVVPEVEID